MERLTQGETYLKEVVDERSLTMEDGRKRGVGELSVDTEPIPQTVGLDDGDSL